MIRVTEKEVLFGVINLIGLMAAGIWMFMDTIADLALDMASSMALGDPSYSGAEVGIVLIRGGVFTIYILVLFIVVMCDLWWILKLFRKEYHEYKRDTL